MDSNRIKKVSELAAKILINEMLELNLNQFQYTHLTLQESVFIERERQAFKENEEVIQAFKMAITENIAKRLWFSSYLSVGRSQTYCTLISESFVEAGVNTKRGVKISKLNLYNLLPANTFIKIDCGNRLVELQINGLTVKTAKAILTATPAKRVIRNNYVNTSLSLFSS